MKSISIFLWIIFLVIILIFSLTSDIRPMERYHIDKMLHFGAYSLLAFVATSILNSRKLIVLAGIILFSLSTAIEYIQTFIPHRMGTVEDALSDLAGILFGMAIAYLYKNFIKKKWRKTERDI